MLTDVQTLASFFYLQLAEDMPAPVLDEDGEIDVVADDLVLEAWSSQADPFTVDLTRLERFIVVTEQLLVDLENLTLDPAEPASPQYMTLVYDAAKETFDQDRTQLRTYFRWLYLVVLQREEGPRWGDFIEICGVDYFVSRVRDRFNGL